jgi:hypothetical protein
MVEDGKCKNLVLEPNDQVRLIFLQKIISKLWTIIILKKNLEISVMSRK